MSKKLFLDEAAWLPRPEFGVGAAPLQKFFVRALLNDLPVIKHDDTVHSLDSAEPVGDSDCCTAFH